MEVMYPRGCRLDVHKSSITAGVRFAQSGTRGSTFAAAHVRPASFESWSCACRSWLSSTWPWNPRGVMGSRCGTFSKATFQSCWPTHSILRQSPAQDGHQGLSVDRGTFAARTLAGQLHSPGADSRPARPYEGANQSGAGAFSYCEPDSKSSRGCQQPAGQRGQQPAGQERPSDSAGHDRRRRELRTLGRSRSRSTTLHDSSAPGSAGRQSSGASSLPRAGLASPTALYRN